MGILDAPVLNITQSDNRYVKKGTLTNTVTDFGAKGDGITDDTVAIQTAFNNGGKITFPTGKVFICSATLSISANTLICGKAELRFVSGVTTLPAVVINGDNTSLTEVSITNPNLLSSQTGGRNTGVQVKANNITIASVTIDSFQNGIVVESNGEYYNTIISNNRIKDIIGAGGGASSSSSYGEDRGDGIVTWGAQATITGNIVNCKAGSDARIGIHAEQLAVYEVTQAPHSDAMVTISDNVVYGPFRRGVVFENMTASIANNNIIADATWWGLCMARNTSCEMNNNSILWTRSSSDNQGSSWSPVRACMMMYGLNVNCRYVNNNIDVSGVAASYVSFAGGSSSDAANNCSIVNNYCSTVGSGSVDTAVIGNYTTNVRIQSNQFNGFTTRGLYKYNDVYMDIDDNTFDGISGTPNGISYNGSSAGGSISRNRVRNCNTAILYGQNTTGGAIRDNVLQNCTLGIDLYQSSGVDATSNSYVSVVTKYANPGTANKLDPLISTKTANYTLNGADKIVISNSSSALTMTLPSAASVDAATYSPSIKNGGSGTLTVASASGTIDGAATLTIAVNAAYTFYSDGTNWRII